MNPVYFRIRLPLEKAMERLILWSGITYSRCMESDFRNDDIFCDSEKHEKCYRLGVNSCGEWTVFEDLTGAYSFISVEKWHEFAENDELIVAGFNDDVTYGEFIVFRNGILIKYFSYDELSDISFNAGVYDYKINYWTDVAGFIEDDKFYFSDKGEVLVYKGVFYDY